jgi:hypothetical protein
VKVAKYVLLAFDNDEEADAFSGMLTTEGASMTVRGVFKKPTQFCACTDYNGKSVRGKKWGWWVHIKCGKPVEGHFHAPRNLLDEEDMPSKDRNVFLNIKEPSGLLS